MGKDEVFKDEIEKASDFKFGANVAKVFDDMVNRSVPYYGEIQRMMAELAADHAREETFVYDLGCSTGTTMIGMNTMVDQNIKFIGVDDSQEMLDKCKSKLMELGFSRPYELRCADPIPFDAEYCRDLGFTYFQGEYFAQPRRGVGGQSGCGKSAAWLS